VGEADLLPAVGKEHGVLARVAAGPDGVDPDLAQAVGGATAGSWSAVAPPTHHPGDRRRERRPGRGVHLTAVVGPDDLGVVTSVRA